MATTTMSPDAVSSLLAGPAGSPPPGVTPNFDNAPNIQTESLVLIAVAMVILVVTLVMRLFTNWVISRTYMIEDFLIFAGAGIVCAYYGILNLVMIHYGVGHHIWDQSLGTFIEGLAVAILIQILKIFAPRRQINQVLFFSCWAWIVVTVIFYTLDTALVIAQCSPREKIWNPFVSGHCITNGIGLYVAASIFNVISDILILVLPLPAIYRLHMKPKKKLLISGLFTTGGLACVASILRLYYTFHVTSAVDVSWTYAPMGITCLFELSMGVVVFCLPVAPRFLQYMHSKIQDSFLGGSRVNSSTPILLDGQLKGAGDVNTFGTPPRAVRTSSLGVSNASQYLGPG
nr:hypothetical protein CFP56_03296 [Quercus suber]